MRKVHEICLCSNPGESSIRAEEGQSARAVPLFFDFSAEKCSKVQ